MRWLGPPNIAAQVEVEEWDLMSIGQLGAVEQYHALQTG